MTASRRQKGLVILEKRFLSCCFSTNAVHSLKLTAKTPEICGGRETICLVGLGLFSRAMLDMFVLRRVNKIFEKIAPSFMVVTSLCHGHISHEHPGYLCIECILAWLKTVVVVVVRLFPYMAFSV